MKLHDAEKQFEGKMEVSVDDSLITAPLEVFFNAVLEGKDIVDVEWAVFLGPCDVTDFTSDEIEEMIVEHIEEMGRIADAEHQMEQE